MNRYDYRLFEQTNIRMMRNHQENISTIKFSMIIIGLILRKGKSFWRYLFLDPREIQNQISRTQMNKLILLDCYDLSDVAYDFLQNTPKYLDNSKLDFQIKEILKRIESNYKNYNPLNIKEVYLRGSINKNK